MSPSPLPQATAPLLAIKATLLLAEFCPSKTPDLQSSLDPKLLAIHATLITSVLKQLLSESGWRHGGINE